MHRMGRAVAVAAVGVGLGIGVGHAALADRASHAAASATATPNPTAGTKPVPRATTSTRPATPSPNATFDDGSADANRTANWTVIQAGTPAARYWARHGVPATSPYARCEAALRVQFVRGYSDPGAAASHQPLWKFECQGVSDATRDSITEAAIEWGATHEEGDG